jgi:serine/threonine-protein kinase
LAQGKSAFEVVYAVTSGAYTPPSQHVSNLPRGLEEAILRGLAQDPDARFPTAFALAQALDAVATQAGGDSVEAFANEALKPLRAEHQVWLQMFCGGTPAEPRGRPSDVMTARANTEEPPGKAAIQPKRSSRLFLAGLVLAAAVGATMVVAVKMSREEKSIPIEPAQPIIPTEPITTLSTTVADSTDAGDTNEDDSTDAGQTSEDKSPPPKRPVKRPSDKAPPIQTPTEGGFLTLAATPYALVRLDGKTLGPTPILRHPVSAGSHVIEFVTPDSGQVRETRRVTVEPKSAQTVIAR